MLRAIVTVFIYLFYFIYVLALYECVACSFSYSVLALLHVIFYTQHGGQITTSACS